jgi:hypothetical protein
MLERKPKEKRTPPVTLAPLNFDDAVGGLLAVKPKAAKKKAPAKNKG